MNIELTRTSCTASHSLGVIEVIGKGVLATVEQPWMPFDDEKHWRYGRPYHSCVPVGEYELVLRDSPSRQGPRWYLQGEGVVVRKPKNEPSYRWGCMFHIANYAHELEGCIAVGMRRSLGTPTGVEHSGLALSQLNDWLSNKNTHDLLIRNA